MLKADYFMMEIKEKYYLDRILIIQLKSIFTKLKMVKQYILKDIHILQMDNQRIMKEKQNNN